MFFLLNILIVKLLFFKPLIAVRTKERRLSDKLIYIFLYVFTNIYLV